MKGKLLLELTSSGVNFLEFPLKISNAIIIEENVISSI